jgi:diguanylate cyclase (GGDEF)-like protein/PAS domain S-box-containing protein
MGIQVVQALDWGDDVRGVGEQGVDAGQGAGEGSARWGRRAALWRVGVAAVAAMVAVAVAGGFLIASLQADRYTSLRTRFDNRQANASRFIEAYVTQVIAQEQQLAGEEFSGSDLAPGRFDEIVGFSQVNAAVLLDAGGRALAVAPARPGLLGTQVGARYAHLRSALAGTAAVSDIVASESQHEPVIGFAVPFETPTGRRVFSGDYPIAHTPLRPFVTSILSTFQTSHVYLIDSTDRVISADRPADVGLSLQNVAAPLARQMLRGRAGFFDDGRQGQHYVSGDITGTPWRLVYTLSSAELFEPFTPVQRHTPWAALAAFLALGLGIVTMLVNAMARAARARDEHTNQQAILDTASDAYISMDATGLVSDWNTAASRLLGWTRQEAVGQPVSTLMIPPRDRGAHTAGVHQFLTTGIEKLPRHPITVTARHRDGHEIPVELTISRSHWQRTWRFHAFMRDITDRLENEQQLQEMALTDSLTGLANHRAFLERLNQAHARARRLNIPLVVLYADVDHFKHINDTHGHAAGDAILRDVADRLRAHFRTEDTVGRLGGDEFAVVCEDFSGDLQNLTERLHDLLAAPYSFRGEPILATVSIGHATVTTHDSAQHLLERADASMYLAKAANRT